MAETAVKVGLEYSEHGIIGKAVIIRILARRKTRREAAGSVHAKNNILRLYHIILKLIREHRLEEVLSRSKEFIHTMQFGLQETYDVLMETMILLKEELLQSIVFMRKQGSNLNDEQLKMYQRYLEEIKGALHVADRYYEGTFRATMGQSTPVFGDIDRQLESYELRGVFNILRPLLETFSERRTAGAMYKVEARLMKTEGKKIDTNPKQEEKQAHELLLEEKKFVEDLMKVVNDMFTFVYIIIKNSYKLSVEINSASDPAMGRYDLPLDYKRLAIPMKELLKEEQGALHSIHESLDYLFDLVNKAERSLQESLVRVVHSEREGKKT